jgi:hypothetical protein
MQIKLSKQNESDLRTITQVSRRTITTEANLIMEQYIDFHMDAVRTERDLSPRKKNTNGIKRKQ